MPWNTAPLSYEKLVENRDNTKEYAERTVARWRRAVEEEDPAAKVWFDIATAHGQMYLILKAMVEDRRS